MTTGKKKAVKKTASRLFRSDIKQISAIKALSGALKLA
jgi:hypothetical protein